MRASTLLVLCLMACSSAESVEEQPVTAPVSDGPDVVIVSIDTLRADRLSTWGYSRETSPTLSKLAASSLRFDRAIAPAPWTLPSVTSLFTGLMPSEHGVVSRDWQLPERHQTLAEQARDAGYETAFFGVNAAFVTGHGLEQGFETWRPYNGLWGRQLNRDVLDFLARRSDPRPLFLVVHYFEPHCRYNPPEDVADRFLPPAEHSPIPLSLERYESMGDCFKLQQADGTPELDLAIYAARYDAEVYEVDRLIGELWDTVRRMDPWLGVVADHGEAFWEHGEVGHGSQLYQEQVRVPMMVRPPGGVTGAVEPRAVSTLWLTHAAAATIAGQPTPPIPEAAFTETDYGGAQLRAVLSGDRVLMRNISENDSQRFDLSRDPKEEAGLTEGGGADELEELLSKHLAGLSAQTADQRPRPPEETEALKTLGYTE